jgi:hypothetical protein
MQRECVVCHKLADAKRGGTSTQMRTHIACRLLLAFLSTLALTEFCQAAQHSGRRARVEVAAPAPDLTSIEKQMQRIAHALELQNKNHPSDGDASTRSANAAESAAHWAFWMFVVAGVETFITALGVFLVYWTLQETRRAAGEAKRGADEARRQADAAEKSVSVARDVARAQVRAYVFVADCSVTFLNMGVGFQPIVHIVLRNAGSSPARNITWDATVQFIGYQKKRTRNLTGSADRAKWAKVQDISADNSISDSGIISDSRLCPQSLAVPRSMSICTH